jgi:hypothetical protein
LDREVVEAIIIAKEGRVGVCIDICLEMSSGIQTPNEPPATEVPRNPEGKPDMSNPTVENDNEVSTHTSDLLGLEGEVGVGNLSLEDDNRHNEEPGKRISLMD